MPKEYDFSGWATRNDIRCSDGRTIRRDAFKGNDGAVVPLVWNHQHNDPLNVLGHVRLENRPQGVYAYGTFNDTEAGTVAKSCVQHGDVTQLSIYANHLKQNGGNVIHGEIREVSLVLAGANPGAWIDDVITHSDSGGAAIIYTGEEITMAGYYDQLEHADEDEKTVEDVLNSLTDEQRTVVYALIGQALEQAQGGEVKHADDEDEDYDEEEDEDVTIGEVFDTLTDQQKNAVYAIIGQAIEDNSNEGDDNMKHSIFEGYDEEEMEDAISHSEMNQIFDDAKTLGSLKAAIESHGITELRHADGDDPYGVANLDYLFPDYKFVSDKPAWIRRDIGWVTKFMGRIKKSPFSRLKSAYANITEDEARAKGYIKGNRKKEEYFTLFKRVTDPQTIYKKQKLDRDDVIDITDLDVVSWIKGEMRGMLDEEIARAALVGDGRSTAAEDHISTDHIRPIWTDDDVYTIKYGIAINSDTTEAQIAKAFIRGCVKARKEYKGSGNPVLYTTEDMLTECLLLEDNVGRMLYDTEEKLRTALRVSDIVTVPVMENQTRVVTTKTHTLLGIIVNPVDYTIGADKGGAINMFDDFDIDYNQMKYLIETRCSGALTIPYAAIAIETVIDNPPNEDED